MIEIEKKVQMIDLDIISMKCIEEAFCETFVSLEERGGGERRKASLKVR